MSKPYFVWYQHKDRVSSRNSKTKTRKGLVMDIEDFADITLGVISLFFIILFGFLIFVWLPTALINQAK